MPSILAKRPRSFRSVDHAISWQYVCPTSLGERCVQEIWLMVQHFFPLDPQPDISSRIGAIIRDANIARSCSRHRASMAGRLIGHRALLDG